MGIRAKVKTARRKASKLHGAQAQYVSLVDRGANETPFTLIKNANGVTAMAIKKRTPSRDRKSHKTVNSGQKSAPTTEAKKVTELAKLVFSADDFDTEAEVLAKTAEMDWEAPEFSVTKNADGDFEVRAKGVSDSDYSRLAEVESDEEGVSAFVGERLVKEGEEGTEPVAASEDDDEDEDTDEDDNAEGGDAEADDDAEGDEDEDDEPTKAAKGKDKPKTAAKRGGPQSAPKSAPRKVATKRVDFLKAKKEAQVEVRKFDAWDAHFSGANTLAKALKDGMEWDGTPPGMAEVNIAFNSVMGNILSDDELKGTAKQTALNKAAADYAEVIGGLDSFFDAYVGADEEEVAKVAKSDEQREILAKWADEYGDVLVSGNVIASPSTEKKGDAAIDYNNLGTTVAEIVAKAVEPLAREVKTVTGTVEAMASRRPTKKAIAPEDSRLGSEPGTIVKSDDDWVREKQRKALM